jgi:inhibitor of cysteine peptidase
MADVTLGADDNGRTVHVHVGDHILVILPENPTTGFRWEVATPNSGVLEAQDPAGTEGVSDRAGGGRDVSIAHTARASGEGSIALALRRPWESAAAAQQFAVRVIVSP